MSNKRKKKDLQDLTNAINKLGDAIEKASTLPKQGLLEGMELTAELDQDQEISMTAQAAVDTLKEICREAADCNEGCPIYGWCQLALPDNRTALPPKYWPLPI